MLYNRLGFLTFSSIKKNNYPWNLTQEFQVGSTKGNCGDLLTCTMAASLHIKPT